MNSPPELKHVIDSLEFQIDDETINALQAELSRIEDLYSENTDIGSVLKRMQSIGRYLNSKRDKVHEKTLPVMHSMAVELERLILGPDLDKNQTRQILLGCSQLYNSLKTKIVSPPLVTDAEIQELKVVILEVDWEISDASLATFDRVTSQLLIKLKSHKILHAFLKIIHSMGRYIASRKASSHKDSIFFLHSVFENFERVVKTPMPFQEKKQLIKRDIAAFNEFKREISTLDSPPAPAITIENQDFPPALSHIKIVHLPPAKDVVLLHPVSAQGESGIENPLDSEAITPALAGKRAAQQAPRDVMDELFTMKESPADQLLDTIHLSAIQGPDQKAAMNMNGPNPEELQKQGIKNVIPTRMDNEPIPEIGSRLDDFFDMDIPGGTGVLPLETLDPKKVPEESPGIFPEVVPRENEEKPTQEAINRLKILRATHDQIREPHILIALEKDLTFLKTHWQDDPDKTMLLDSLAWLARQLKTQFSTALTETYDRDEETELSISETPEPETPEPETPEPETPESKSFESELSGPDESDLVALESRPQGFWRKIKSLFIS